MPETWTREKIKAVLDQLKQLPDFDCIPLPEEIYKEYNIPMPQQKSLHFLDYINRFQKARDARVDTYEVRESDGILREVKGQAPPELIICAPEDTEKILQDLKAQSENETQQPHHQNSASPKVSSETTPPECPASPSFHPCPGDEPSISLAV